MAAKKQQTAMVPWKEELKKAAQEQRSEEKAPTSRQIKIQGGRIVIDDNPVPDNELEVVVLAALHENQYFTEKYDANNPAPPDCYAFRVLGQAEEDMTPHEKCEDKKAERCGDCELNVFGSADTGRGKACKNIRKLAVIPADACDSADDIKAADPRVLKLPVTSVRAWASYVTQKLAELEVPLYGAVTKITVTPDAKTQFKVNFAFEKLVEMDGEKFEALKAAAARAFDGMAQPYQPRSEEPAAKPAKGKPGKRASRF